MQLKIGHVGCCREQAEEVGDLVREQRLGEALKAWQRLQQQGMCASGRMQGASKLLALDIGSGAWESQTNCRSSCMLRSRELMFMHMTQSFAAAFASSTVAPDNPPWQCRPSRGVRS